MKESFTTQNHRKNLVCRLVVLVLRSTAVSFISLIDTKNYAYQL
jgi:hypothetical protein